MSLIQPSFLQLQLGSSSLIGPFPQVCLLKLSYKQTLSVHIIPPTSQIYVISNMPPEEHSQASQETAAVSAHVEEAAKTKASNIKKKSKGAVPNKGGVSIKPLYREMVVDAIVTQKERLGSSLSAIKNHLSSKYKIDIDQKSGTLNR